MKIISRIFNFLNHFWDGSDLKIDPAFEYGDRIKLPTGEICEVKNIGMRDTYLYNVSEHTEISIPNSKMAEMAIRNTTQPKENSNDKEQLSDQQAEIETKD